MRHQQDTSHVSFRPPLIKRNPPLPVGSCAARTRPGTLSLCRTIRPRPSMPSTSQPVSVRLHNSLRRARPPARPPAKECGSLNQPVRGAQADCMKDLGTPCPALPLYQRPAAAIRASLSPWRKERTWAAAAPSHAVFKRHPICRSTSTHATQFHPEYIHLGNMN